MSGFQTKKPLVALVLTGAVMLGCKPLKVSSDKSESSGACPEGSVDASGFCIKDGIIYLLHDVRLPEKQTSAQTSIMAFPKQTFVKGDRIYAFGRFSFTKSGAGGLQTLGFNLGEKAVGSSSTQFVGDQDGGVLVSRNVLAHEVSETIETSLVLKALPSQPAQSDGSDGGLLLFRTSRISEALATAGSAEGVGPYFVHDMIDSDKLVAASVKTGGPIDVLNIARSDSKVVDIALLRSGVSWEPAAGSASACEGVAVTWHLSSGDSKILSEGPYIISSSRPLASASMQVVARRQPERALDKFKLTASLDTGGRPERAGCVLKINEPSTLSVVLFRSTSDLLNNIQNARYLHRIGSVSAAAARFPSNASGPPIETLLQFNWDHLRSDSLLSDVLITLGAEDRVKATKAYIQLSRAPDSLSSHLGQAVLKGPDRPRTLTIFDMATEANLNSQTRFYLTGMGFNDDSKPVILDDAKIHFMHFRRLSDNL